MRSILSTPLVGMSWLPWAQALEAKVTAANASRYADKGRIAQQRMRVSRHHEHNAEFAA
jgi:hypothetical protein